MNETPSDEIFVEHTEDVVWLTLNRPARLNAVTHDMESGLISACENINCDRSVKAVVIIGAAGERPAFAAGADLNDLGAVKTDEDRIQLERHAEASTIAIESLRVPSIAAIDGVCVGAGALLAVSCDFLITTERVQFGFPIARTVSNCLSVENLSRLINAVGLAATRTMIYRAKLLDSSELAATGAVTDIVADRTALVERADTIAGEISALAPVTLALTKETLLRMQSVRPSAENADLVLQAYRSRDYQEAITAFLEKRVPHWAGE